MNAARLLRYRGRALWRRASGAGSGAALLGVVLPLLAATALALLFHRMASADLAAHAGDALTRRVQDRVFWLDVLQVLVFAYTTFEVIFRPGDAAFVGLLPLRGRTRWVDLLARAFLVHAPLLLPALAYGGGLAAGGAPAQGLYVALATGVVWLVGIPLCALLHLLAGRSMLGDGGGMKKLLAGGAVEDEAAMLLYSPAAGLAATLVGAIGVDQLVRAGLGGAAMTPDPGTLAAIAGGALVLAGGLVLRGAREADRVLAFVGPRFAEVDVAPPYRDDGLPESSPGEALAPRLPRAVRPYFLRDLHQLRRRHRLDRILLWLHAAIMLRLSLTDSPAPIVVADTLTVTLLFAGLLWIPSFRLRGPELGSPWLDGSLPHDPGAERTAQRVVALLHPAWALLWAAVATAWAAGPLAGLVTLGAGGAAILTLVETARVLARRTAPERATLVAGLWKAALVAAIALTRWRWL